MNRPPAAPLATPSAANVLPDRGLKIFVVGTGRSGTHWLGQILQSHPDIHVTVEAPPIFTWATEMALDPRKKPDLLPRLVRQYEFEHRAVAPRHYADKSHPNIWQAEDLAARLPDAVFLGIQRNPFATVASMLQHPGVLAWHERWHAFPTPNRFLGITADNQADYASLPPAVKCALRWRSHALRMDELRAVLGGRLLIIRYEDLIVAGPREAARLTDFLRLSVPIPPPSANSGSLDRWRQELPAEVQRQIASVTGIAPGDCLPT